jgi:hypothetical protein
LVEAAPKCTHTVAIRHTSRLRTCRLDATFPDGYCTRHHNLLQKSMAQRHAEWQARRSKDPLYVLSCLVKRQAAEIRSLRKQIRDLTRQLQVKP